ncbi:hypothetical protein SALBM311S_00568 [Streptomyces alboniger]
MSDRLAESHLCEGGPDLGGVGPAAREPQRQPHVLFGRQRAQQVERLEDETDPVAAQFGERLLAERAEIHLVHDHPAGVRRVESGRALEEGALARSGRAHDRGEGGALEGRRGLVEGAYGRGGTGCVAPADLFEPNCLIFCHTSTPIK